METKLEELEVDLRIANARADLAMKLVFYLCDELGRSGVINWTSTDLKRQFMTDVDYIQPEDEMVRLDMTPQPEEVEWRGAVDSAARHTKEAVRLRKAILELIRNEHQSHS